MILAIYLEPFKNQKFSQSREVTKSMFFLGCTILYFSGYHFLDHFTIFSQVILESSLKSGDFVKGLNIPFFLVPFEKVEATSLKVTSKFGVFRMKIFHDCMDKIFHGPL